jgi:uncharacterized repeat protein (TIGR02543 family)
LSYGSIPEPVYTANTFVGWAYDDAGTVMVSESNIVTDDDTIYAIWEADGE